MPHCNNTCVDSSMLHKPSSMKLFTSLAVAFVFICSVSAQEITATILDTSTNSPIPYVAVQTAEFKGVISNEEGVFVINKEDVANNTIELSCLGYQSLTVSLEELETSNYTILLHPAVNELNTVYLTNTRPNVDSIILRAKRNLKLNYRSDSLSYNLFYRETSSIDFKHLDFEVKKASHFKKRQLTEANERLKQMGHDIMNGNVIYFTDYSGKLHVLNAEKKKLQVDKATKILNSKENISLENIQENAQHIVLRYLDTTKTYKLKTGLFKIEDSLSLTKEMEKEKNNHPNEMDVENLRKNTSSIISKSQIGNGSMLTKLLNTDNYEYTLKNANVINGEMIYLIEFTPKRSKANYTGSLYISEDSYAVLKLDYRYAKGKRGEKINLRLILGVKYIENVSQGTIVYQKNAQDYYAPRYIKSESGEYFYLHRPLKFIENSSQRNKTAFDFKIEGNTISREELLFSDISMITASDFDNIIEQKSVSFENLRKYDANVWTGQETLAPSTELKAFDAEEQ